MIIKPPQADEYNKIIECIVEARGTTYYSPKFYDPEYLSSGEHELFAAYNENGEMVGFTGLSYAPFENERAMLSLLNIRPSQTGKGTGTKLLSYTVELLKSRGIKSVKGHVITRYPSIQNVLEGLGLRPAGMLYGIRDGRNAVPVIQGKCTLALYVCNFNVAETGLLFIHDDIAGLAADIYSELNISVNMQTTGKPGNITKIEHFHDTHDDVLFVQITECGNDFPEKLNDITKQYRSSGNLTELVFLSLQNGSAIFGYEALLNAGYDFCGFDPLGSYECALFYRGEFFEAKAEMTGRLKRLVNEFA